jgi:S-adenosylmethionine hydrolase
MITLITDFGDSEYVGAMKGVIYSNNPSALIVDVTHSIPAFDIRRAAYALYTVVSDFPEGTVHVVVVDPGVGTERKGLIIKSQGHFFVGPDNGVFSLIDADRIYEISVKNASSTFHGRDVFAPIAVKIDMGETPEKFGSEIEGYKKVMKKEVEVSECITGVVYCIDSFGNIITSIKRRHLEEYGLNLGVVFGVKFGERVFKMPFMEAYGDVDEGDTVGLVNSAGYFEVSVREGNAAERLGIQGAETVEVSA